MEIIKLHPEIGAEVRGVSMSDVASNDNVYRAVRAAFEEHSVLLFRNQPIDDQVQVGYSAKFGPLETAKVASLGEGTPFSILTNIDSTTGDLVPPTHKEALRAKANQLWHTDSSFRETPALASVLSARTIPGVGGETEFVSQRATWNRLPESLRAKLDYSFAWHSYAHSRGKIDPSLASQREQNALPPACWRMRWRNPVNGRNALYIASHTYAIEGMADKDARVLIDELTAIATAPGHSYEHTWRAGDVIMWDNRASMHRGRPWPLDKPRYMIRTYHCRHGRGWGGRIAAAAQGGVSAGGDPRALHLLTTVFGHRAFRGAQQEIVTHVAGGGDALVLMPTGGGKSLCYQLPALLREGTALVVSPLIALMQDQVAALKQLGVRAAFLNSTLDGREVKAVERMLREGELDLLYVAPERLMMPRMLELLHESRIALFAIDEAHCVSQWGHDFRPEYLQLSVLHEQFPVVPRIALTATADPQTRGEIVSRLRLDEARIFVSSFDRPNIRYTIVDKQDARTQLLRFIREDHTGDAGIVYCLSRKKVNETAAWLATQGVRALPYHAGMDAATRARHQARFQQEDGVVIIATIAFGMGIDKPDVRFVAHLDLPKSIEGYYQETGRAGRDGAPADAWMAYGLGDVVQQRRMIDMSEGGEAFKRVLLTKLDALLGLCESAGCRRVRLLDYFGESSTSCGNCDNCIEPPQTWDATEAARKALSCIYRTGQRFGAVHLIDVLRGRTTERTAQWNHDKLSVFGIGADTDEPTWRNVFRQLVALSYARPDHEAYGSLQLTDASRAVLRGEIRVEMRRVVVTKEKPVKARRGTSSSNDAQPNAGLLNKLKDWRFVEAQSQSVPAFVIFHDSTLAGIAAANPKTLDELSAISGIGAKKLERYGTAILDLLHG